MTYKDLLKTFEILSTHKSHGVVMDWVNNNEWGIDLLASGINLSSSEIRELAEMGWCLGSDDEYDEEKMSAWIYPEKHSDEEIVVLFNEYKSIYKYV